MHRSVLRQLHLLSTGKNGIRIYPTAARTFSQTQLNLRDFSKWVTSDRPTDSAKGRGRRHSLKVQILQTYCPILSRTARYSEQSHVVQRRTDDTLARNVPH